MLQKISIFKHLLFYHLFSTLKIIRNVPNQHIRIISEGSCDTEDWGNDAKK